MGLIFGLFIILIAGGAFLAALAPHQPATQLDSTPPLAAAQSTPPPASPAPAAPAAPVDPDAGKPRGNKNTDWTHSSITLNGKMLGAITDVQLTSDLRVAITTSFGAGTYSLKEVPQGFLNDWGITGDNIDAAVVAQKAADDAKIAEQNAEEQRAEQAQIDASATTLNFIPISIINDSELVAELGEADNFKTVHISGINTTQMADGNYYSAKVWRDGVFRYTTVLGSDSQVESYTAERPSSP